MHFSEKTPKIRVRNAARILLRAACLLVSVSLCGISESAAQSFYVGASIVVSKIKLKKSACASEIVCKYQLEAEVQNKTASKGRACVSLEAKDAVGRSVFIEDLCTDLSKSELKGVSRELLLKLSDANTIASFTILRETLDSSDLPVGLQNRATLDDL